MIVAVVSIVGVFSLPLTLGSLLGAISAGAGAAASVLGGLGYAKLAKAFGLIAVITGFGSIIATKLGVGLHFANERTALDIAKAARKAAWTGIFLGAGAIANSFQSGGKDKPKKKKTSRDSIDKIAIEIIKILNPLSIGIDKEIATAICRLNGTGILITNGPHVGEAHGSDPGKCPEGTEEVGFVHTHGAESGPSYDDEVFGPKDKKFGNNRSLDNGRTSTGYLGTPSGKIIKFIPASIRNSTRGKIIVLRP